MWVCRVHTNGSIFHQSQIFSAKIIIFLDGFVAKFTALSSWDNPVFVWLPFLQLIPPSYLSYWSSDVGSYVLLSQFSDWLLINFLPIFFSLIFSFLVTLVILRTLLTSFLLFHYFPSILQVLEKRNRPLFCLLIVLTHIHICSVEK